VLKSGESVPRSVVVGVAVGAILSLLALMRSSATVGDAISIARCKGALAQAAEYGSIDGIARGETSTAALAADWQEMRFAPDLLLTESPIRRESPTSTVTVCLFRGEFGTPTGPPKTDGSAKPLHNIIRLLVFTDGEVSLDSAGYEGQMAPETPSDWLAATDR
jgi:hypothetical protein